MIQVCLWPHQHPLSLKSCQIFWLRAQNISSDGSSGVEAETDGEAAIVAQELCMEIGQICVCVCVYVLGTALLIGTSTLLRCGDLVLWGLG